MAMDGVVLPAPPATFSVNIETVDTDNTSYVMLFAAPLSNGAPAGTPQPIQHNLTAAADRWIHGAVLPPDVLQWTNNGTQRFALAVAIVSGKGSSPDNGSYPAMAFIYPTVPGDPNYQANGNGNGQTHTHGFGPNGEAINVTVPAFGTEIAAGGAAFTLQVCGASGRHGCVSS